MSSALPPGTAGYIYPVVTPDTVFLSGEGMDSLFMAFPAHCATDGSVCRPSGIWNVPGGQSPSTPIIADGEIFISSGGQLLVYPESCAVGLDCLPLWAMPVDGQVVVAGNNVFVSTGDGIKAFPSHCETPCQPLWWASVHPGAIVAANGLLFSYQGETCHRCLHSEGMYAFPTACGNGDVECKPAWTWRPTEHIYVDQLAVTDNRVYAATGAGTAFGDPGSDLSVFAVEPGARTPTGTSEDGADRTGTIAFYLVAGTLASLLALVVVTRRRRTSNRLSS